MPIRALVVLAILLHAGVALAAAPIGDVTVTFEDRRLWLYHALEGDGVVASAQASAPGEDLASVTVSVATWGSTTLAASGRDARATHAFDAATPGAYAGTATARTTSGAAARDSGILTIDIVPLDPMSVAGFPRLETVDEPPLSVSYVIQTLVRADGSVKAYRVSAGGQTQMDTLTQAAADPSDTDVRVTFARGVSNAQVHVDGSLAWSGAVRQSAGAWWHVVPVGEVGAIGPTQPTA